jgi:hypothetical protein
MSSGSVALARGSTGKVRIVASRKKPPPSTARSGKRRTPNQRERAARPRVALSISIRAGEARNYSMSVCSVSESPDQQSCKFRGDLIPGGGRRPPRYCSSAHRQADYRKRRLQDGVTAEKAPTAHPAEQIAPTVKSTKTGGKFPNDFKGRYEIRHPRSRSTSSVAATTGRAPRRTEMPSRSPPRSTLSSASASNG